MNFLMIIGNVLQGKENTDHLFDLYPAILQVSCVKCIQVLTCFNFEKTAEWENEVFINGNLKVMKKIF